MYTFSELTFTFAMSSPVRLSVVCRLSVCITFVHPTQAIEIFGNVSTPFRILAISDLSLKLLWRSSRGNPSVGGLNARGLYLGNDARYGISYY